MASLTLKLIQLRSISDRSQFALSVHTRLDQSQTGLDRSQTRLNRSQTRLNRSQTRLDRFIFYPYFVYHATFPAVVRNAVCLLRKCFLVGGWAVLSYVPEGNHLRINILQILFSVNLHLILAISLLIASFNCIYRGTEARRNHDY